MSVSQNLDITQNFDLAWQNVFIYFSVVFSHCWMPNTCSVALHIETYCTNKGFIDTANPHRDLSQVNKDFAFKMSACLRCLRWHIWLLACKWLRFLRTYLITFSWEFHKDCLFLCLCCYTLSLLGMDCRHGWRLMSLHTNGWPTHLYACSLTAIIVKQQL